LGVTLDLFSILLLQLKILNPGFEFSEFVIGKILEFNHPAQASIDFIKLAHKFQVTAALGIGALHMPAEPAGEIAATQFVKGGAVKVFIHLLKNGLWQLGHIFLPIACKEGFQLRLIRKCLHILGMAGGHVNSVNFVKILGKYPPHIQVGQLKVIMILQGQHAQVEKGYREKSLVKELMHVELLC
jgi:hypothetical protein